jgi:hypothetical protein
LSEETRQGSGRAVDLSGNQASPVAIAEEG